MTGIPLWFWLVTSFVLGITVGSFLTAVNYRLPGGLSLLQPVRSICPSCKNALGPLDLVPLLSYLLLGRKCRQCKEPIASSYFMVELTTGLLFAAITWRFEDNPADLIAMLLFGACLVPIFCIDLETFTIPTSLNLLILAIAVGRDFVGITGHEPGHELIWNWLPHSVYGAIAGILIFGAVRVAGWLWKRQEAMGLGDVLLARGMGAMLANVTLSEFSPLRLFPMWVLMACVSGIVVGVPFIAYRKRVAPDTLLIDSQDMTGSEFGEAVSETGGEIEYGEESGLWRQIKDILYVLFVKDSYDYVRMKLARTSEYEIEDDFVPAATAIPFGPFLVIGFLGTVFFGEWLTAAYLAYALPKKDVV